MVLSAMADISADVSRIAVAAGSLDCDAATSISQAARDTQKRCDGGDVAGRFVELDFLAIDARPYADGVARRLHVEVGVVVLGSQGARGVDCLADLAVVQRAQCRDHAVEAPQPARIGASLQQPPQVALHLAERLAVT
jgi:hypothetical protein